VHTKIATPKTYLYKTAHRLSLNAQHHDAIAARVHAELAHQPSTRTTAGAEPGVVAEVRAVVKGLHREERDIVTLRVYGGMTFQEIADTLNLALGTVHSRYAQAVVELKRVFEVEHPRGDAE
jgi:DNA-directed RNA polymerase specialized sigma24 family protein